MEKTSSFYLYVASEKIKSWKAGKSKWNDKKLEKTIRQWWKSLINPCEPLQDFWHDQSQFTIGKTESLGLLRSHLWTRFQGSIINGSFGSCNEVITGVPQGFVLDPLHFNIFLNDIFLFISKCELCDYADNNTL